MSYLTILGMLALAEGLTPKAGVGPSHALFCRQQPILEFTDASGPDRSVIHVDLGEVDPVLQPTVTQEFRFRNTGSTAARIRKLQGSCGCTSLLLDGHAVEDKPIEVAPGAGAVLQAIHDLYLVRPGQVTKFLWVYLEGMGKPAATVEIKLNLRPCVRFVPNSLVFGRVPAGESRSLTVHAEIDGRVVKVAGREDVPLLGSSDPDMKVDQLAATSPHPPSGFATRTYRITLGPNATLGVHFASLAYPPSTGGGAVPDPKGLILGQVSLGVQAVVEGRISVTPAIALFGEVQPGKAHRVRLDLAGKDPKSLQGLSVLSGTPWLSARVLPAAKRGTGILEVVVAANAPTGSLQGQVVLRTADRQRLVVPVNVAISSSRKPAPMAGSH